MAEILMAASKRDIVQVRELFHEYADWLGEDVCLGNFEEEVETLPGLYAPPAGRLLLARAGPHAVGCGGFRPLEPPHRCEMKRLYVRPSQRGLGLGRALAERLIREAVESGYTAMRLDTLPFMTEARRLYAALGFVEVRPPADAPAGVVYMELPLATDRVDGA